MAPPPTSPTDRKILLGITGGIAAYKAAELIRLLRKRNAMVRVVMTREAAAFVSPLTCQALSGQPVRTGLLNSEQEAAIAHIELARWPDQILVAPATANFIAKLCHGLADDLLSTLCLAAQVPILLAPAMNQAMWSHPATRDNVRTLRQRGTVFLGPATGEQACGEEGPGRMMEPAELCQCLAERWGEQKMRGLRVLISAGPTREAIDPVRYISNRSSGKMGIALARAAQAAGAEVTLVCGPIALPIPAVKKVIPVETAGEMLQAVTGQAACNDLYIGAAAVADYTPSDPATQKIKKAGDETIIRLKKNPDILAQVARMKPGPFTVGFAAETERLESHAREKLEQKDVDMVAANLVAGEQGGFESDHNALQVFWKDGQCRLPLAPKQKIAERLMELIAERYHEKHST